MILCLDLSAGEEANGTLQFAEDGTRIIPFNTVEDREEGYFDEQGHYIENKKVSDAWLDEMEEQQRVRKDFTDTYTVRGNAA